MSDIKFSLIETEGLSEPGVKLIETVRSAIGAIYEPTHIRRIAKAEVDAAIIKKEGEIILYQLESVGLISINNDPVGFKYPPIADDLYRPCYGE